MVFNYSNTLVSKLVGRCIRQPSEYKDIIVAPAQVDIKEVIKAVENRMTAIYQLAEKVGTLSAAALAFTITFAKSMTPPGTTGLPIIIKIPWLCFLAAVIGFFLVYLARIEIRRRARVALLAENDRPYDFITGPWYFKIGRWLTSVGFLGGLFLLAIYGLQNF